MALFKIQKGPAASLGASGNPTEIAQEGFAYFTPDDGKFYIDIENANEAVIGENRIPINAYLADKFSSDKLITLTGDVTGTDAKNGETGWSIATTLRNSGVIGGLYGPEGNEVTNGAVVIPRLTINEKGLITGAESVEVRISGIADTKVTQDLEANNGEYFPLFTPKNQGATANTTATFNRYVKVNPYISEWTFLSNNGDSHHDTPSFILSRSNNGANLKLWGQSGDFYISSDYWINSKKTTFSEHLIKLSPANASITFQGHLLPNSSGWTLGSILAPWEAGFFNQGLMIRGNLNYGSSSLPIYWNNGIPTPITSYEGTATRAISDDDGNNIKNTYASNLTFTNGLLILKNKNGIALDTITLDTLTVSDITTGTEDVRKLITAKVFKDSVDSLISQLNVNEKTFANGEVLKTLKEENGKIGLTTGQLSIDGGILAGSYVINLKEDNSSFSQLSIGQMQGATATTPGAVGLVPQTVAGDQEKFLRGDGQWIIPTNTDYQVRQTNTGADKDYRILLSYSDTNNEETNTVYKHSGLLYNPSSNTLTVTYIEGRAATAGRANADSLGNVINTTYALKTAAVSNIEWNSTNKKLVKTINGVESDIINFIAGDNITFTSDNTGLTITATDTNTTYSLSGSRSAVNYTMLLTPSSGSATQAVIPAMTPATEDAGGLLGLVPNSAPGDQNKFLRADGTWTIPTNTNDKVQSVKTDSTDANYKILFSYTDTNSNETNYVRKDSDFYYNPNSNTLTVTQVAGNAQTASKANADSAGNIIINTYAKKSEALTSITWDKTNKKLIKTINGTDSDVLEFTAGNNVTLTADDNKITITTANDNTTYGLSGALTGNTFVTTLIAGGTGVQSTVPAMSAASASMAGRAGLVPAPQAGDNTKVLSGAGTWIEQSSYSLPLASSSTRGGIKIGFAPNPNTKNYALLLDDEKAYVNVPWTDRSVEGPGYHYIPQEDSASVLSAPATGGTAEWGIDVVQGVKIRRDNRGHITGLEVISGKIPDQPTYPNDRDPGYGSITIDIASTAVNIPTTKQNTATITAATYSERLTLSPTNKWIVMGAADNSSTGLDKIYIGHDISTVTKGSYGPSTDVNVTNGGNFKVPYVSVDEAGHITGASTKTITLPTTSDTKVTQYNFTQNSDLRVILSNNATGNEETATVNKSNNLTYNPSTNILNTGNLVLSDDLSVGGDVDITGALDVTGDVTFIKTPNAPTAAAGSNDTRLATTAFVTGALSGLVGPMRFIGTLGIGGTATALASASANNKGYTYKVITAGTYQDAVVKVGDLVISNGSSWIVIPSGDEPSGTVTNIATGEGLTGGPISSSGTISHAIPSGANAATLGSSAAHYYIKTITTDKFGHITNITTGQETVSNSIGTQNRMAYYSATNMISSSSHYTTATEVAINKNSITSNYTFEVNGNSIYDGDIRLNNTVLEKLIESKKSGGPEWARNIISILDKAGTSFAHLGAYGSAENFYYLYLGSGVYNSANNLRIYPAAEGQSEKIAIGRTTAAAAAATLYVKGTPGEFTFRNRKITPVATFDGQTYFTGSINAASLIATNVTNNSTTPSTPEGNGAYYLYGNNVEYAKLYIRRMGLAPVESNGEYNNARSGSVRLSLGNAKVYENSANGEADNAYGDILLYYSQGENYTIYEPGVIYHNNDSGLDTFSYQGARSTTANEDAYATWVLGNSVKKTSTTAHSEGRLRIYSDSSGYHQIVGTSTTGARVHYFPDASGWIVTGGNGTTTGVGGADQIVYLSTSGVLTAGTSATNANTTNTIVKRDASGNFSAGTITATLSGNAATATAANITSTDNAIVRFDGTVGKFQNSKVLVDDAGGITLGGGYLIIKPYSSLYDTTGSHAGIRFYFNHDRSGYNADTLITGYSLQATNFYGTLKGNADTATIAAKLSNTSKIGDINHPVYFTASGVPVEVTLVNTANNLLSSLPDNWTADPTDNTVLIRKHTSGANSFGQVTFKTVWNYIQNKMISEGTNYFAYLNTADSNNSNTTFYIHTNIKLSTSYQRIAGELIGTGSAYHSGILSYSLYARKTGFETCYYVDFYNKLNADIKAYVDDNDYLHIAITPKATVYTQWYLNCFVDNSAKNKIESVDQTAPTIVQSKELTKLIKSITYTPAGTNKKSEVTIKPVTTDIYSMTSAGSVTAGTKPSLTMSVDESTETLSFTWSAGTPTSVTLPGRSSAIAAWTGYTSGVDNTYAAAQEFTGTQATITI